MDLNEFPASRHKPKNDKLTAIEINDELICIGDRIAIRRYSIGDQVAAVAPCIVLHCLAEGVFQAESDASRFGASRGRVPNRCPRRIRSVCKCEHSACADRRCHSSFTVGRESRDAR